jgi:hypothetical protein
MNLKQKDVRKVAFSLMQQNGITTTLEVKNALRNAGFYARQYEVSALMDKIADKQGWFWTFNGRFRTYSLYPEMQASNPFFQFNFYVN